MENEMPLKKLVSETLKQIQEGLPKNDFFAGNVNFDVTVAVQKSKGGKLNINILGANANKSEVTTQRISFSAMSKKSSAEGIRAMNAMWKGIVKADKASRRK
jgi:hypothetical protein